MGTIRRDYATGSVLLHIEHDLAVVTFSGILTPSTNAAMLADLQRTLADARPLAAMALMQNVSLAISPDELLGNAKRAIGAGRSGLALPVVLVSNRESLRLQRDYARLMCEAGYLRGVVTSAADACRWVDEKLPALRQLEALSPRPAATRSSR